MKYKIPRHTECHEKYFIVCLNEEETLFIFTVLERLSSYLEYTFIKINAVWNLHYKFGFNIFN